MKIISSILQRLHPPDFANEEENRKAKILFLLTRACFIGFVTILGVRIVGTGFESNLIFPLFASLFLLSFSHTFLLSKRLEMASYTLLISLFGLSSYLLFISEDGYHDTVMFAVPGLLIIAGILLKKWQFYIFTALTLLSIAVIVGLENFGIHKTRFSSFVSLYDGIDIIFVIAITAVSIHILTNNLIKSLQRAKADEKALQDSEAKHRKLVSNISDVIVIMDKNGIIRYKSPNITEQFGWSPEELIGKHGLFTAHIDDQDKISKKLTEVINKQDAKVTVEYKYLCKDGSFKPVELTAVNMLNDPVINGVLANYRDITERQKANENLRKSEEKFRTAFKTSPNAITLTRIEDGIYADINDGFTRLLGYTPEEVIGKSSLELDIWNDSKDRDRLVVGLKKDGLVENLAAEFKGKSGQIINGLMSASILDIENKKHILGVTQDITELKQSENERLNLEIRLQQAQKMESIGTLAGGIAHDFNNILSGIFGYSQLALKRIDNPNKVKDCILQIDNGSKRAAELVRQILTFSRQTEYQKFPLQIYIAIKEAIQLLRSSIPSSIEIKTKIDSKEAVLADPTKIHQLIINLCTNAHHAIGKNNGTITVSLVNKKIQKAEKINSELIPAGDYLELEVSDTGAGMDKTMMEKVFDPYFTTKQIGRGTGLGLALVKAIVKEHEGFITIASKSGQGTSFFVYLPVFHGKTDQISLAPKESIDLNGNEKILIVDDEEAIRDISENILKEHGYSVSAFENGLEAFSEFEKDPYKYDLIITDMTMPKMSGDKLAIELLKKNPDIPVLLCTGLSETISKEKMASIGIKKILSKPLEMNDLVRNIREVLDGK